MEKNFKVGDNVSWESAQGTIRGKIIRKLTKPMEIKGHHVTASKEQPQWLVESDKTGEQASHKPEALTKEKKP